MSKKPTEETIVDFPLPSDNIVQTFQLESSSIRGRVLKIGSVLEEIIQKHGYPETVNYLIAELTGLSLLLASILKYDGVFTLQLQGDGPISMMVADVDADNGVRACATFDADKVAEIDYKKAQLKDFFGEKSYLAFTVDPGGDMDRYQGIVSLEGASLSEAADHYFQQSEQLQTTLKLKVKKLGKSWRAGGIMIQRMPLDSKVVQEEVKESGDEDWSRSSILLGTVTDEELTDPRLHENTLLTRLFHEEGVRVYTPEPIIHTCRCSERKLDNVLATLPLEDLEHITIDGKIEIKCEFCSKIYRIEPPQETDKKS
ncbi:MAG: molecular chaperone Hsp33 [Micavibrio sp.]|nr:molecular chaperone Hsp33 [Micavibrio sp.]|tara:strand:- start:494295 stop:495236 length:942 start_codon:yes stop_codon:yes gene_type:complete